MNNIRYTRCMLHTLLLILNAVVAISLILIILLQRQDSSGGGIMGGANLGSGPVARNPLAKVTAWLAAIFMMNCVVLAVLSINANKAESVFDNVPTDGTAISIENLPTTTAPQVPAGLNLDAVDSLIPTEIPIQGQ